MEIFYWKTGFQHHGVDPQKAHQELDEIEKKYGTVSPELVLERASQRKSVLHPLFTWDDTEAARKQRLAEAGHIIRSITIRKEDSTPIVRAFHCVRQEPNGPTEYVGLAKVLSEPELLRKVIERAKKELIGWTERYSVYEAMGRPVKRAKDAIKDLEQESQDAKRAAEKPRLPRIPPKPPTDHRQRPYA